LKLFSKLKFAKADGTYDKELKRIQKPRRSWSGLILDDFGLHPIDEQSKLILLELLEDRYGESSTINRLTVPGQSLVRYHRRSTIADAILDRLVHNAYQIQLAGESMRKTINTDSG